MGRDQPANVAASVRQRLLNRARHQKQDYQVLLTRYILERFLYRLSQSPHQERFIVNGALTRSLFTFPQASMRLPPRPDGLSGERHHADRKVHTSPHKPTPLPSSKD